MANDVELLRLYAEEKSETAFRELVEKYLNMVYSAALRRVGGDAHAAQDVSQQVFAALAQRALYLPTDIELSGWLYGTTRNLAADCVQKERRRKERETEAYAMETLISEPENEEDWERLKPVLDREIDKLGARDREALLLRFFAQRPFAEVGRALGVSADAARMRVDRALERLHRSLVRQGAAPTLGAMTILLSEKAVGAAPTALHTTLPSIALASAATATNSLLGSLHIMATAKTSLAITISALVGIGLLGYREFRATQTMEAELASENSRTSSLQHSIAQTRREIAGVESDTTRSAQFTARTETLVDAARPPSAARMTEEMIAAGDAFMAKYPEVRATHVALRRGHIAARFHQLFQELALTQAQIDAFETIVFAPSNGWTVRFIGLPLMRLVLDGPSPDANIRVQLEQLLGANGYQHYADYAAAEAAQVLTEQLARNLYITPTPLSGSQAAALIKTVKDRAAPVEGGQLDWKSVLASARAFLSEPQLEWLRGMEAEDAYRAAMTLALTAARQQAPKAPSP